MTGLLLWHFEKYQKGRFMNMIMMFPKLKPLENKTEDISLKRLQRYSRMARIEMWKVLKEIWDLKIENWMIISKGLVNSGAVRAQALTDFKKLQTKIAIKSKNLYFRVIFWASGPYWLFELKRSYLVMFWCFLLSTGTIFTWQLQNFSKQN